jgi:hypothetical protein
LFAAADGEGFRVRVDAPEGSAVFSKSRVRCYSFSCSAGLSADFSAVLLTALRDVFADVFVAAFFLVTVVARGADFLAVSDVAFFAVFLRVAMIRRAADWRA